MPTTLEHMPSPLSAKAEAQMRKDLPDWYLRPLVEEGLAAANAGDLEDGEVFFKRLFEKFEKKYGKLNP